MAVIVSVMNQNHRDMSLLAPRSKEIEMLLLAKSNLAHYGKYSMGMCLEAVSCIYILLYRYIPYL